MPQHDAVPGGSGRRKPPPVPPANFCRTLAANVDNAGLSDAEFRQFVRNSLPVVDLDEGRPKAQG
jgi:hypothetical protein